MRLYTHICMYMFLVLFFLDGRSMLKHRVCVTVRIVITQSIHLFIFLA